jgi:hypothetical protein
MLVVSLLVLGHSCPLLGAGPEQTLAAMDACRDRVIDGLSLGDKMTLRSAMDAIQGNPDLVAANRAVANAPSAEARVVARNKGGGTETGSPWKAESFPEAHFGQDPCSPSLDSSVITLASSVLGPWA